MHPPLPLGAVFLMVDLYLILVAPPAVHSASAALECYSFTWPGINDTIGCDDKNQDADGEAQPCIYPLVYTIPYYSPPNISELDQFCSLHYCPDYKCKEKGKQCIRWNWYDVNDRLTNYSVFCGTLADQTNPSNPVSMTGGCWHMRVGTFLKEVCVCNTKNCNTSPGTLSGLNLLLVLPLVALFLPSTLHT